MSEITQARVKELFDYNPITGLLTRKVSVNYAAKIGNVVGSPSSWGYLDVSIDNRRYKVHRIIWLWVTGKFPKDEIDHDNHIRDDNHWNNLFEATRQENGKNQKLRATNKSGFTGVCWGKQLGKWRAGITVDGRTVFLGGYDRIEDAISARQKSESEYGYHRNHGML